MALYEFRVDELEGRHFADLVSDDAAADGRGRRLHSEAKIYREDAFLASANLCRWIIDFHEIQVGKQVGIGSYGVVYRGRWKGVDVAVKRFIKQKLDERLMLEFRAEMAFLSELHHPNIVLFIGTSPLCSWSSSPSPSSSSSVLSSSPLQQQAGA
jgi:serine/threonine protein kinase